LAGSGITINSKNSTPSTDDSATRFSPTQDGQFACKNGEDCTEHMRTIDESSGRLCYCHVPVDIILWHMNCAGLVLDGAHIFLCVLHSLVGL
jgi:hypothetical protein